MTIKNKTFTKMSMLALSMSIALTSCSNDTVEVDKTTDNEVVTYINESELTTLLNAMNAVENTDITNYKIVNEDAEKYTYQIHALDTIITLIVYTDDSNINMNETFVEIESLIDQYENLMSRTINNSFTYNLNENKMYSYKDSMFEPIITTLVDTSLHYAELSNGKFDVTIEPLVSLWDINNYNTEVPKQSDIDTALSMIDYNNLVVNEADGTYELLSNAQADFGAIAKGHVADIIRATLLDKGINSALINLGGNVALVGAKPGDKDWVVGLQDPNGDTNELLGTIKAKNKSIVTSGVYQRFFIQNGVRYHHILDPDTGYPSDSNLLSTTIISDYSIDGDALSTTTFLLDVEDGMDLINNLDGFEAVFITGDNELVFSDTFTNNYELSLTK